ncbi:MAG: nuclear transport factor 2 family protein [Ferruginibacter sp.]
MNSQEIVISNFYSAFQLLDHQKMNQCYVEDIVFFDPIFGLLRGEEARSMWEMLCSNAKDFSLVFGNIVALDSEYYTCDWIASYTFSKTGKRVVNKVKAHMMVHDGKIVEHSDGFSVHQWSRMALGFSGWLLGWNSFYQNKIKREARKNLDRFMGR